MIKPKANDAIYLAATKYCTLHDLELISIDFRGTTIHTCTRCTSAIERTYVLQRIRNVTGFKLREEGEHKQ